MTDVVHIVGPRPNLIKLAPLWRALQPLSQRILFTGQHRSPELSTLLMDELELPVPDVDLQVGGGTHADQTARAMLGIESELSLHPPRLVVLYGDVNSTLAGALVCAKLGVPFAHVEAGLRSFDRTMPEEVNRLVVDRLATLHLTHCEEADANLLSEGILPDQIHRVGNLMIDSLQRALEHAAFGCEGRERFLLVTLHRPANVDDPQRLATIVGALRELSKETRVVFPVHPRTLARLERLSTQGLELLPPVGYLRLVQLLRDAAGVLTDSGGLQEEAAFLG